MSIVNLMSATKPKIPNTRRSDALFTEDLQELKRRSRHDAVVSNAQSDFHMPDGPASPEQLELAPTVAFRNANVYKFELDLCTDGDANASQEHGNNEVHEHEVPEKTDDGLALAEADRYSNYEVILTMVSILSYIFDIGSDIYLAFVYYRDGDIWWFTLTVIFISVPSVTITVFSFVWYVQDSHRSYRLIWLPRLVLLFLQLAPLLRFIA